MTNQQEIGGGWTRYFDEGRQQPYVHNYQTSETFWTEETLPIEWAIRSFEGGDDVFFNVLTQEATFERPNPPVPLPSNDDGEPMDENDLYSAVYETTDHPSTLAHEAAYNNEAAYASATNAAPNAPATNDYTPHHAASYEHHPSPQYNHQELARPFDPSSRSNSHHSEQHYPRSTSRRRSRSRSRSRERAPRVTCVIILLSGDVRQQEFAERLWVSLTTEARLNTVIRYRNHQSFKNMIGEMRANGIDYSCIIHHDRHVCRKQR